MKISEFYAKTKLNCLNSEVMNDQEISGVFIGDLLSWVMGNGEKGQIWITIQAHLNVVAVAALKEFSAIILAHGVTFDEETLAKASEEKILVFSSDLPVYEVAKICQENNL